VEYNILITVFVFLFGISLGSFLNVLIYRVPEGMNINYPSSKCPKCENSLKWYHNIPILSWLFLGGKCAYCKEPISKQYPIVEFVTGFIWLLVYFKLGLIWYAPFVAISFSLLLALTMIDFKYYAVPDSINFAALFFALINNHFIQSLIDGLMAAVGFFLIGFITSKLAKKDSLGEADIIVAATMAALLGFPAFFVAMFLSAILALLPSLLAKDTMVPFVPFLALATFITYINKEWLLHILKAIMYG